MTVLRPFWCYYGGKWRSAPSYPQPLHDTIIEPFAGAAGYATRYYDRRVVLVEADPVIAGLWRWLIKATPEDVLALPLEVPKTVRDLGLPPGPSALIGFWMNKGASAPCQTPSSWMRRAEYAGEFWGPKVRQRVALQVDAIKHWTVIEGDYTEAPDVEATWYVDPPYHKGGKHYRRSRVDYTALGAWCQTRPGQVIVCEEQGGDWLPFRPHRACKANESRSGGKVCHEVIWTGGDGC